MPRPQSGAPDGDAEEPLHYTIATAARRTGISVHTLRAWERRYGIPAPARSPSRYRLYSDADLDLVRRVRSLVAAGAGPAEAARRARLGSPQGKPPRSSADLRRSFIAASRRLDPAAAQLALGEALAGLGVAGFLDEIVGPALHEVGRLWEGGVVGVDVEHFASQAVRVRLGALLAVVAPGRGGRRAVLACPAGESHDLALMVLSVRLGAAGWEVSNLGADLPLASLLDAVRQRPASLVAISVTTPSALPLAVRAAVAVRGAAGARTHVLLGGHAAVGTALPTGVEGEAALARLLDGRGAAEPASGPG